MKFPRIELNSKRRSGSGNKESPEFVARSPPNSGRFLFPLPGRSGSVRKFPGDKQGTERSGSVKNFGRYHKSRGTNLQSWSAPGSDGSASGRRGLVLSAGMLAPAKGTAFFESATGDLPLFESKFDSRLGERRTGTFSSGKTKLAGRKLRCGVDKKKEKEREEVKTGRGSALNSRRVDSASTPFAVSQLLQEGAVSWQRREKIITKEGAKERAGFDGLAATTCRRENKRTRKAREAQTRSRF